MDARGILAQIETRGKLAESGMIIRIARQLREPTGVQSIALLVVGAGGEAELFRQQASRPAHVHQTGIRLQRQQIASLHSLQRQIGIRVVDRVRLCVESPQFLEDRPPHHQA